MPEHDQAPPCDIHREDAGTPASGSSTPQGIRATRRDFIKSVIASGVAVSAAGYVVVGRGGEAFAQAAGTVTRLVTLNVNGRDRPVDVLPNETLIHTLRYKLGLIGTKLGCDHSECGNCTVMLDDVASYSCSTLTHGVRAQDRHHRGHRGTERRTAQGAESHDRGARTPVRLLHLRPGGVGGSAPQAQPETDGRRSARRDVRQSVPVRR